MIKTLTTISIYSQYLNCVPKKKQRNRMPSQMRASGCLFIGQREMPKKEKTRFYLSLMRGRPLPNHAFASKLVSTSLSSWPAILDVVMPTSTRKLLFWTPPPPNTHTYTYIYTYIRISNWVLSPFAIFLRKKIYIFTPFVDGPPETKTQPSWMKKNRSNQLKYFFLYYILLTTIDGCITL